MLIWLNYDHGDGRVVDISRRTHILEWRYAHRYF
jgi:hypothetical protein